MAHSHIIYPSLFLNPVSNCTPVIKPDVISNWNSATDTLILSLKAEKKNLNQQGQFAEFEVQRQLLSKQKVKGGKTG